MSEAFQPKSVLVRNADFTQYISTGQGIIDFDSFYDNEMAKNKFIIKFVNQVKLAIDTKVCKVPKDFKFPDEYADRLDKIWNGNAFYGINQDPFRRKFLYYYPSNDEYQEVIPLPKFKNMIPVNKIADETLLIQVREEWAMRYAVEGSSYVSLINNGGFMHGMSDGGMPMFSEDDMESLTLKTYYYSRPVYNSLMNDFEHFFNDSWNHISIEFQKIIDFAGMGEMGDEDESGSSSFITGVD